ncbi:MAG: ComEC/Rec2 family competence protein [Thermoleophilia bacterium]
MSVITGRWRTAAPHALLVALLAGLILANARTLAGGAALAAMGGAVMVAMSAGGRGALAALALALCLGGWMWGTARIQQTRPARLTLPVRVQADGVVDATPRPRAAGGWRVPVRLSAATPGSAAGARVLVSVHAAPPALGAIVRFSGMLRSARRPGDPAWWRRYLDRQGIAAVAATGGLTVIGARGGLAGLRDATAAWLRDRIGARLSGDRGALVQGMALGGTQGLSASRQGQMQDAGMTHLLAVSGQNVAVVVLTLATLLRRLGTGPGLRIATLGPAVIAYCWVCEPGASVGRAGVVTAVALVTEAAGRARDRVHALLLALAVLLAWQPRGVWDPGLQLSFGAVVGIIVLGPALREAVRGWLPDVLGEPAAISAAAGLATAPITALDFGRLSLAGFVTNIVAVPLAGVVLVAALTGALTAPLLGAAAGIPLGVAGLGAEMILRLAALAAALPGAVVHMPAVAAPLAALPALAVGLAAHHPRVRRPAWWAVGDAAGTRSIGP